MTTTKHWTQDRHLPSSTSWPLWFKGLGRGGQRGRGRGQGCHSQAIGQIRGRKVGLLAHGRQEQIQNVQKCSEQLGTQESGQGS